MAWWKISGRMTRAVPLLLLGIAIVGCGKKGGAVQLDGNAYYFPAQHVSGIVEPEKSGSGRYYIRLVPPGGYYWLVHDPTSESRANNQGPGVPTIAHINDHPGEVTVTQSEAGPVVCKAHPVNDASAYMRQIFTCGFRIHDNGVEWSVIIPGDLVASAPALKRRAELTLADYRRDARAKSVD